jgi:hypothetical protein
MIKPSKLDRQLAELKISELQSVDHVDALQKEMLQLLTESSADPISYVGLEYCSADHCGRVNCSEACWFGTLRRRNKEEKEIGRLLREHKGRQYEVLVVRSRWDRRYGDLHEIDVTANKRFVRRVLDSFSNPGIVAVGTLKVRPFGYKNFGAWRCEIHLIVTAEKRVDFENGFHEKRSPIINAVFVTPVKNIDGAIQKVMSCNEPADPADRHYVGQRAEFYAWLANMEVGSRLIRYGCDEEFRPLHERPKNSRS